MAVTYPVDTIAKLLDLTPRRVQQLAAEGIIPRADGGRYELVPVVRGYVKYLRDRAIGAEMPAVEGEHKRRLLKPRADIAEFEAQRLAGDLVPLGDVEKTWTQIVSQARQRMLGVAPKAAPLVAVETAVPACHEIIETPTHEALAELANTPIIADRPAADPGGGSSLVDGGAAADLDDL